MSSTALICSDSNTREKVHMILGSYFNRQRRIAIARCNLQQRVFFHLTVTRMSCCKNCYRCLLRCFHQRENSAITTRSSTVCCSMLVSNSTEFRAFDLNKMQNPSISAGKVYFNRLELIISQPRVLMVISCVRRVQALVRRPY